MKNHMLLLLAALALAGAGCSREGFRDAVANQGSSSLASSSSSMAVETVSEEFGLETGELSETGVYMAYALPRGNDEQSEAADAISQTIHSVLMALPQQFDLTGEGALLEVYDSVTKNDGKYYSIMYEISYLPMRDGEKEGFCFGLAFDSLTGERLTVSDLADPKTLSVLALDAQLSAIKNRDEQATAQQREILEGIGSDGLYALLLESEQESLSILLEQSVYIDGSQLVVVIARPEQPNGCIRVAVAL